MMVVVVVMMVVAGLCLSRGGRTGNEDYCNRGKQSVAKLHVGIPRRRNPGRADRLFQLTASCLLIW